MPVPSSGMVLLFLDESQAPWTFKPPREAFAARQTRGHRSHFFLLSTCRFKGSLSRELLQLDTGTGFQSWTVDKLLRSICYYHSTVVMQSPLHNSRPECLLSYIGALA